MAAGLVRRRHRLEGGQVQGDDLWTIEGIDRPRLEVRVQLRGVLADLREQRGPRDPILDAEVVTLDGFGVLGDGGQGGPLGRDRGIRVVVQPVVELAIAKVRGEDRMERQGRLPIAFGEHGEVARRAVGHGPEYGSEAGRRGAILPGMTATAPSDPVVLITGATGGLGRVTAAVFAADGARLGLVGTDPDRLAEVAAETGVADDRWVAGVGDLTDPAAARAAVEAVADRFGRIDCWLHVVGGWAGGTAVVDLDHEELSGMLDQHLWTTLNVAQAVVPGMTERGWGRVVAVSTPFAMTPGPRGASYAVARPRRTP